jgi:2-polyprenyl-3-methyl-5-hydroxy-6-metoxy-1,4-benzoquinol methylase
MFKPLPPFPGASRGVSETEIPIEGDNWFWADDNAKVLELLSHPLVWRERPEEIRNIIEFIIAMCEGPFIFRRIATPRLVTASSADGKAEFLHSLMNVGCDLPRGVVSLGMRFHDGRTARNVQMTGNYVRFHHGGKVFTIDVEEHIRHWSIDESDGELRLVWKAEIDFGVWPKRRLGELTYTITVRAASMFVDIEAALELDPNIEVSDVILTFAYDALSLNDNNVRYEDIRIAFAGKAPTMFTVEKRGGVDLPAAGATYWCVAQRSHISGFALAVHSLPRAGSPIDAIRATSQTRGQLHWLVSEHRFAGPQRGGSLVAGERKIITAGGFYDEPDKYAAMLAHHSDRSGAGTAPIDLSISYDYGAEVKAFARCFRSLSLQDPPVRDIALRDELRRLVDHFHQAYQTHFIAPYRGNASAIFSRSISFMAFAYADMMAATGDPMYRNALREACEIISTFERQNESIEGGVQSGFLMGQESDSLPYPDCHGSCLLALVRGTELLDETAWLASIDRGLAAYRIDTIRIFFLGMQKQDLVGVDYKLPDGSRRTLDTFWNFNGGLTLRLFNALRATRHSGLRSIWEKHAPRLEPLEFLIRHRIGKSLRPRGDAIEILSSMLSMETNSETQPWAALALIGEQNSDENVQPLAVVATNFANCASSERGKSMDNGTWNEEELVSLLYRSLLQRDPDPAGLSHHIQALKAGMSAEDIIKSFTRSEEFEGLPTRSFDGYPLDGAPPMRVDTDMTAPQSERLWAHVGKAWKNLGSSEPYWSVLTAPRWKIAQISLADAKREFYETGRNDLVRMEQWLARNGVDAPASGTCIEYGCGVGRCTAELARRFDRVIAFDVSEPHLALARAHIEEQGLTNVEFVHVRHEEDLQHLRDYDFFYSFIVLQHNPPPLILSILARAFDQLRPGGTAFFQVPTYALGYTFNLSAYLDQLKKAEMEMHFVPQRAIFESALRHGMRPLEASPDGLTANFGRWISTTFLLSKSGRSAD